MKKNVRKKIKTRQEWEPYLINAFPICLYEGQYVSESAVR